LLSGNGRAPVNLGESVMMQPPHATLRDMSTKEPRRRLGPARFLVLLPASALAVALAAAPAAAQTLEDLQRQIQDLQRQVDQLQERQDEDAERVRRVEEAAPDRAIASGRDDVRLAISGQVNRGLMVVDDGSDTTLFNIDNNASSSRIRAIGEARPTDGLLVGGALEFEFRVNNSFTVSQRDRKAIDDISAFRNRRVEVYFDHDNLGRVWLGQGWTATEFVAEQDLSGTALAGYSDPRVMGGGMFFRDKDTGELSDVRLLDVVDNMDGFGRDTRIRYDTPRLAGLQLRTSLVRDDAVDVALNYEGQLGPVQVAAMVGYANFSRRSESPTFDDLFAGSISVLHDTGINLTLAAGTMDRIGPGSSPNFHYAKLGYQRGFFPIGNTALSVDYHQTDDLQVPGDRARAWGVQAVQTVDGWGTELYLNLRNHELKRPGRRFDDLLIGMVGARVRF
jgi:hypothetical protein